MANAPLYTKKFLLLCTSFAFFGASFNMIIPELPQFLSDMGGAEYKGFIISLFTLTAGLSRPFSGKLADTIGRIPVIIVGALVCIVCSLMYPLLSTVGAFMFLRLCHGFSTGFTPTAITAYVADIVSVERRGEAMGIIGVSVNLGASISPPIGSFIAGAYSLNAMFFVSSMIAVVSVGLLAFMKETLPIKQAFHPKLLMLKKDEIIDFNSILPAIVCGLTFFGLGVILTIVPDQCDYLGISNKGIFFTSYTLCTILSRLIAGKASDRYGRIVVIKAALIFLGLSHILMAYSYDAISLLLAAGCIGFSMGIASPAIFAWTIDRSTDDHRGRAMATMYIGLEAAIGFGALLGAALYANQPANFKFTFIVTMFITMTALIFLHYTRDVPAKPQAIDDLSEAHEII